MRPRNDLLDLPAEIIVQIISPNLLDIPSLLALRNTHSELKEYADMEIFKRTSKEARRVQKSLLQNGLQAQQLSVDESVLLSYFHKNNLNDKNAFNKVKSFLSLAHKKNLSLIIPDEAFQQLLTQLDGDEGDADPTSIAAFYVLMNIVEHLSDPQIEALTGKIKQYLQNAEDKNHFFFALDLFNTYQPRFNRAQLDELINAFIPTLHTDPEDFSWDRLQSLQPHLTPAQLQRILQAYFVNAEQFEKVHAKGWYPLTRLLEFISANLQCVTDDQIANIVAMCTPIGAHQDPNTRSLWFRVLTAVYPKLISQQQSAFYAALSYACRDGLDAREHDTSLFLAKIAAFNYQQKCPAGTMPNDVFAQFMVDMATGLHDKFLKNTISDTIEHLIPLFTPEQLNSVYEFATRNLDFPRLGTKSGMLSLCEKLAKEMDTKNVAVYFDNIFNTLNNDDFYVRTQAPLAIVKIPDIDKLLDKQKLFDLLSVNVARLAQLDANPAWDAVHTLKLLHGFLSPTKLQELIQPIVNKLNDETANITSNELEGLGVVNYKPSKDDVASLYTRFIKDGQLERHGEVCRRAWKAWVLIAPYLNSQQSLFVLPQLLKDDRSLESIVQQTIAVTIGNLDPTDTAIVKALLLEDIKTTRLQSFLYSVILNATAELAPKLTTEQAEEIFAALIARLQDANVNPVSYHSLGHVTECFIRLLPKLGAEHVVQMVQQIPLIIYATEYFGIEDVKILLSYLLLSDKCDAQLIAEESNNNPIALYLRTIQNWFSEIKRADAEIAARALIEASTTNTSFFVAPAQPTPDSCTKNTVSMEI